MDRLGRLLRRSEADGLLEHVLCGVLVHEVRIMQRLPLEGEGEGEFVGLASRHGVMRGRFQSTAVPVASSSVRNGSTANFWTLAMAHHSKVAVRPIRADRDSAAVLPGRARRGPFALFAAGADRTVAALRRGQYGRTGVGSVRAAGRDGRRSRHACRDPPKTPVFRASPPSDSNRKPLHYKPRMGVARLHASACVST